MFFHALTFAVSRGSNDWVLMVFLTFTEYSPYIYERVLCKKRKFAFIARGLFYHIPMFIVPA